MKKKKIKELVEKEVKKALKQNIKLSQGHIKSPLERFYTKISRDFELTRGELNSIMKALGGLEGKKEYDDLRKFVDTLYYKLESKKQELQSDKVEFVLGIARQIDADVGF